ncbi:normal mucosa of esophagus-specific gene 1 protein [Varanus komodoensis]|uniref:Chromosome 15 open reading frame 48 n=1 Tax=Varanus komodoensis TaxID=61221 RepID=A0A8D2L8R8_VARKO|nr:normal mucosa of esophagus-specific gene 1 protein [Varanus komodoensis]
MGLFQHVMKHKELIPLLTVLSLTGCGLVYSAIHALRKPEVIFNKSGDPEPWQYVNPTEPQKLVTINQEWKPIEELEKVRKLMK